MKYIPYYILLCFVSLITACSDDSEKLTNKIDFSSPYVIQDDPSDPVAHRRYEIYKEYEVSVFFNDTIQQTYIGKNYDGSSLYRYETLDLNWEFYSQTYSSIDYDFDYLTTQEKQMKALDFVDVFLKKATGAMRPFCMFLTDTVTVTETANTSVVESKPVYLTNYRTLVMAQLQDYNSEQLDSLSTVILRSMVKSKLLQNKNLIDRFGAVSSKNSYYARYWVNDGTNGGLGCTSKWFTTGYTFMSLNGMYEDEEYIYSSMKRWNLVTTFEDFEAVRNEMMTQVGAYGFISGDRYISLVKSPSDVDDDIEKFIDVILEIGAEEFNNRYGNSPLVMEKYNILADYIENDLGVAL